MDEYAAGRTPNPCLRCNEKIKFAAVLDRALALGFDAVATGHYAQAATPTGVELHRAVDPGKDQSYVLGVLTQDQLAHSLFPLGDTAKPEVREEAARRGLLVADKPDSPRHLLRRRRRQRRLAAREAGRPARGARRRRVRRRGRAARRHVRVHDRPAPRARAGPARRRPAVRARHRAGLRHRHGRAGISAGRRRGRPARGRCGPRGRRRGRRSSAWPQLRAHARRRCRRRRRSRGGGLEVRLGTPVRGVATGQAVVLYDGDTVLGSATIAATRRVEPAAAAPLRREPHHPRRHRHDQPVRPPYTTRTRTCGTWTSACRRTRSRTSRPTWPRPRCG